MPALPRVSDDFLNQWESYSEYLPSPKLFKKWGGLFLVSAALARRCWAVADPTFPPLFPNLFILLVGPPGCGKDIIVNKVAKLLTSVKDDMQQGSGFRLSGRSVSAKGIIDLMADEDSEFSYKYTEDGKKRIGKFHSVTACIPELGTFLPAYDAQLVAFLNELYNCNELFEEQIRGRGSDSTTKIVNPHLAMLLGTQPTTLSETFPEQAFRMGFFSRTNIIHTREIFLTKLYDRARPNKEVLFPQLATDLKSIASMHGKFKTTKAFEEAISDFHVTNPRKITHSRFDDYNTRRSLHLHKLAMICSASESNKMLIDIKHFERAQEFLYEAEDAAPSVFSELTTSNGFSHTVEQVLESSKGRSIIPHQQLERTLRRTHKPYEVGMIIKSMISAGDLTEVPTKAGLPKYKISRKAEESLR